MPPSRKPSTTSARSSPPIWIARKVVQAVTDAATELTTAEFGAFFYNLVNEHGESYTLYTISGVPREAFSQFPMPRNTEVFAADLQGDGRRPQPRHHEGSALRSQRAASRDAAGPPAGAKLSGRAGQGPVGRCHRRTVLRPFRASDASASITSASRSASRRGHRSRSRTLGMYTSVQEASRIKDDFLASLSHELRTPLNAILGYARMLRSGIVAPDKKEKAIETIERNATSLTQIVEDVLDISRIVSGKIRLNVQPVEFPDIVRSAVDAIDAGGRRQGRSHRDGARSGGRAGLGRSGTPAANPVESAVERGEVHEPRRQGAGPARAGQLARGGRGQRHRHRHRARVPAARVRAIPPGGRRHRARARRPRSGPVNRPSVDGDARRHDRRVQRRRRQGRDVPVEDSRS